MLRRFSLLIASLALTLFSLTSIVWAQPDTEVRKVSPVVTVSPKPEPTKMRSPSTPPLYKVNAEACTKITNALTQASGEVSRRVKGLDDKKTEREKDLTDSRDNRDSSLAKLRADADTKRAEHYAALREKATTATQKAAVETFIMEVDAVITARRAAVDSAIEAYRSGVDAAIATQQTTISDAQTAFRAAVSAAYAKASDDCAAGVASETIAQTLRTDLASAKTAYQDKVNSAKAFSAQLESLNTIRNAAIDKAMQDFKVAYDAAKAKLKLAFPTISS